MIIIYLKNEVKNHCLHIILIAFNLFRSKKIVGLTASVGVGKAKNEEKAMDWIFSMMANMDAEELCVVEENKAELAQHVNIPDQSTVHCSFSLSSANDQYTREYLFAIFPFSPSCSHTIY